MTEAKCLLGEAISLDPANSIAFGNLARATIFEALFRRDDGPAALLATRLTAAHQAVTLDMGDATAKPCWRYTGCSTRHPTQSL
jgi:hypothetical protein